MENAALYDVERGKQLSYIEIKIPMVWFVLWCFNATFNNISVMSWRSVLLVEETRVLGENHRPIANHWQIVSHNIVSTSKYRNERGTNCTVSCKSNYHTIMPTTGPQNTNDLHKNLHESGADPGFCVRGDESRRGVWGQLKVSSGSRAEPL